jgi:hypothetical protein
MPSWDDCVYGQAAQGTKGGLQLSCILQRQLREWLGRYNAGSVTLRISSMICASVIVLNTTNPLINFLRLLTWRWLARTVDPHPVACACYPTFSFFILLLLPLRPLPLPLTLIVTFVFTIPVFGQIRVWQIFALWDSRVT